MRNRSNSISDDKVEKTKLDYIIGSTLTTENDTKNDTNMSKINNEKNKIEMARQNFSHH